jgi:prepilin signal peptidase PulO-like enzyme (type II secretory pathway)
VVFYTDIIIPLVGLLLLWWQWRITSRTAAIT